MQSTFRSLVARDIVVIVDGTDSMEWCFRETIENIAGFSGDLVHQGNNWRLALYVFRDLKMGQGPSWFPFTTNIDEFQGWLRVQKHFGGGGNGGESSIDAAFDVLEKCDFRPNAGRYVVLFTDDAPHDPDQEGRSMSDLVDAMRDHHVVSYIVSDPLDPFLRLADSYGGLHFNIRKSRGDFRRMFAAVSRSITAHRIAGPGLTAAATAAAGLAPGAATRVMPAAPTRLWRP